MKHFVLNFCLGILFSFFSYSVESPSWTSGWKRGRFFWHRERIWPFHSYFICEDTLSNYVGIKVHRFYPLGFFSLSVSHLHWKPHCQDIGKVLLSLLSFLSFFLHISFFFSPKLSVFCFVSFFFFSSKGWMWSLRQNRLHKGWRESKWGRWYRKKKTQK